MDLEMRPQTLLLGECLPVARRMRARRRMRGARVMLQRRPCGVKHGVHALCGKTRFVHTGVAFICETVEHGYATRMILLR